MRRFSVGAPAGAERAAEMLAREAKRRRQRRGADRAPASRDDEPPGVEMQRGAQRERGGWRLERGGEASGEAPARDRGREAPRRRRPSTSTSANSSSAQRASAGASPARNEVSAKNAHARVLERRAQRSPRSPSPAPTSTSAASTSSLRKISRELRGDRGPATSRPSRLPATTLQPRARAILRRVGDDAAAGPPRARA